MTRAKDTRIWARFTVEFCDSPKVARLSDSAFRALVEMILWSRRMGTDGVLPARYVETHWGTPVGYPSGHPKPKAETETESYF